MAQSDAIRALVARLLGWEDAHVAFDTAVDGLSPELQGRAPADVPYSPWQLVEHIRVTQHDILEFCRNPEYEEMKWPSEYWPSTAAPPTPRAWNESVAAYRKDRKALAQLAADTSIDLLGKVPAGDGQTYLRELLLVADHTAYHVGELVVVRRALGAWPPA